MQVRNELATRHACSGPMLNVVAIIVNFPRIEVQRRSPSVIDMLTEFAANELEDMEGELAGRCNSLTQQQAMRVCVRLDVIWLDFVSRRLLPLEEGEVAISNLCPIAGRLTNLLQNHSAEAFRQVNDQIEGFPLGTLFDEVFSDETLDDGPDKTFVLPSWQGCTARSRLPSCAVTSEVLCERVAKHDLYGPFLLKEDWWDTFA